ncbi:MAG: argininosuccinate lyase [Dehalococcoidia bacterium]|nr:argininosuccinate lyase [Dehalococcoidia bacterium]
MAGEQGNVGGRVPKAWGGRFAKETDPTVEAYTESISFDWRLYRQDIAASIAHARMLGQQGIITTEEAEAIVAGLTEIGGEIERGEFAFEPSREDIHLNIEARLAEKIGDTAGKLHTARSRNDQVATDVRLWCRAAIDDLRTRTLDLQAALIGQAERYPDAVMPGYTHLQRAQPVLFAHHLLAYVAMLERDHDRLDDCRHRTNVLPLGAGALAGVGFPIDPQAVADELELEAIAENSMDSVGDRDFAVELVSACSLVMVHLSRLAEDVIVWSSGEFGFVELDDAYATGSSIMPQKKNPDVAELTRGKTGRVFGHLQALLTLLKGLPLTYNRDLQEDKEAIFDAVDTTRAALAAMTGLVQSMAPQPEHMAAKATASFSTATELADYLAQKGLPFRQAHEVVGKLVAQCLEAGKSLEQLTASELTAASPQFGPDALARVTAAAAVAAKDVPGGTAPRRVAQALAVAKARLAVHRAAAPQSATEQTSR